MVSRGRRAAEVGARVPLLRAARTLGCLALSALGACSLTSIDSYFQCPPSDPRCKEQPVTDAGSGGASASSDAGAAGSGGALGGSAGTGGDLAGSNTGATGNETGASGDAGAGGAGPIACTTSADCNGDTCSRGFCGPAFTLTYADTPDTPNEAEEKWIKFTVQLNNRTSSSVNFQDFTIRYYFTYEGNSSCCISQVLSTMTPPSNVSQIDGTFGDTPVGWKYLEIGFESSAGKLGPESSSGVIQMGVRDSTFSDSAFDELNDYSLNNAKHLTMYRARALVWGIEPTDPPPP